MKKPNGNEKQLAVQGEPSVLELLTDEEISALMMQEPLPPNQPFQLPSEEQATETPITYIYTQ